MPAGARRRAARPLPADAGLAGSRAEAERLLRDGAVLVDGAQRPKSHRLRRRRDRRRRASGRPQASHARAGAARPRRPPTRTPTCSSSTSLPGSSSTRRPGIGAARSSTACSATASPAATRLERPGIVHRLDRDTSGLLVVARDPETHRRLQRLLRRRELVREYLALVRGRPRSWHGRIEAPIGRDRRDPTRISLDTAVPREAITHFEVVELLAGSRPAADPPRDRQDAPDPRAPGRDRAARLR